MEFFENLIMKDKEYEILTNEEPREKDSPRIVETQPELRISKGVRKTKDIGLNKIDSQLI